MFSKILKNIGKSLKPIKWLGINEELILNYFKLFSHFTIFNLSKLVRGRVDNKLIILGGNYGKYFGGNTKYLYQYLKEYTDYKLIWISKSQKLIKHLKKKGINAVHQGTLKAIKLLRKARVVFVTHGFTDVLPIKFSSRTVFVQTWHGGDIKILGGNSYYDNFVYSNWTKFLRLKIRNHQIYDYVLSLSDKEKPLKILAEAFKFPLERIIPLGYPRNDIFFSKNKNLKEKLRKKYDIPHNIDKIILYAPTFRSDLTAKFPLSHENLIELNQLLKETKSLFLMKGHIREKYVEFKDLDNILTIGMDSDTQELLYITDILITDYSSIYCDYLLLNRPVILFTYDYDEYIKKVGIYYNHLEEIAPGPLVYTGEELIEVIRNISKIDKEYETKRLELRDYFNAYIDGKSTERLLKFLKLI